MEAAANQENRVIFALDIGTRSVIGVVGVVENGLLRVLQVEELEHTERAVVDGQIENIDQTVKVAKAVKERLEQKLGFELKEVYVAAAGRVLKTKKAACEMELDDTKPIDQRQIFTLESKAIQQAYEELMEESREEYPLHFYCAGHSILSYTLDGYSFSTLLGHRGRVAKVELIGTFLPSEVVESLYATMSQIGLSIASVTLEPIAAINAVIPQELRLLNVALVDVGAGTSDIAIANNGCVCAYTMATMAGDEITENIMREFLVDFGMAEEIKRMTGQEKQSIEYTDILGNEYLTSAEEVFEKISPSVEELAKTIGEKILESNGKPPMAVFMVGGGSRTPELCRLVSASLGIDEKKVAIGGNNYMKRMVETEQKYISAEYATPIGIAISAMSVQNLENSFVTINGNRVQMMRGNTMSLMEALIRGGYEYSQFMGRSGQSVTFELNGEKKIVRGGLPRLSVFEINGHPASIATPLQGGDEIYFVPAVNGEDAHPLLKDFLKEASIFEVELEGMIRQAGVFVTLNGGFCSMEEEIRQADKVETYTILTIQELFDSEGITIEETGIPIVNGQQCFSMDYLLRPGDKIAFSGQRLTSVYEQGDASDSEQEEAASREESPPKTEADQYLSLKEEAVTQPTEEAAAEAQPQKQTGPIQVLINGKLQILEPKNDQSPIQFFDLLNYVDIDPKDPQGEIVLMRNRRPASYIEFIQDGDTVEIFWKKS